MLLSRSHVFVRCLAGLPLAGLMFLAISCGRINLSKDNSDSKLNSLGSFSSELEVEKITFVQWCERWGMTCPSQKKIASNDATAVEGESKESLQWQAIAQLFERFATSGSNFALEDSELTSAKTRILMTQIGWQEFYGDVLNVLGRSGIKRVSIEPIGQVHFEGRAGVNGQSGTLRGRSGMKWTFGNQGQVFADAAGNYVFNGLLFAAANSLESDVFGRLGFNDLDQTTWSGSNLAVTHIPDGFFIRDVPVRWEKFSEFKREQLLRSVTELRNLTFAQGRTVRFNNEFFNTAARHIPLFVEDAKVIGAVTKLTDALGSLELKAPQTAVPLAQLNLERAKSIMCRIEMSGTPAIELTLDRQFGVQNAYTNDKFNAQIDLFGINFKAKVGLPISFNVKRIDVEPTRIVVKGVPVVGEISIPLPDENKKFDKELKKLECSERI